MTDPRQFSLKHGTHRLLALTSLSWLLPVELTPDGREIVCVHYDQAIEPAAPYQEYGVEAARISRIDKCLVHDDLLGECRASLHDAARLAQWSRL
jgi:hypothetical protein